MFNLEQAIAEWRQRMLAGGIECPTPLDELESHLRDEVEQRVNSGLGEAEAFQSAVCKIGWPRELKSEFARADGVLRWLGKDNASRITRFLAIYWAAQCLWFLTREFPVLVSVLHFPLFAVNSGLIFLLIGFPIYSLGLLGAIHLFRGDAFRGDARGPRIIRIMAILGLVGFVAQIAEFHSLSVWGGVFTVFNLITLWLVEAPEKPKQAAK